MLIWGTKNVTRHLEAGAFHCPSCKRQQNFTRMRVQRHGHVYWIPLFAVGKAVEYVECRGCGGAFDPAVLDYQPLDENTFRDELSAAVLATLVAVAKADGSVDDTEVDVIQSVVLRLSGSEIDRAAVQQMAASPDSNDLDVALHMLSKVQSSLSSEGKEIVVKAALMTAMADGDVARDELERVGQVAGVLGVSSTHLRGIVAEVGGAGALSA